MATTTPNFGWPVPTSTDLVKDGATAIEALGDGIDTSLVDLKGGTTGQVLSKTTNTDMDFTWVTTDDADAIQNAIVDAKGDLIAASAADTPARLAVGANNTYLIADSTQSTGLAWAAGTYTTFTPGGFGGFTLGNGTVAGRYRQFGKTVFMEAQITLGSTSSVTGSFTMQFPVSSSTLYNNHFIGLANLRDIGAAEYFGRVWQTGTNFFIVYAENVGGTYSSTSATSSTVPFTWTTGDIINITATYEAA
jgi:hypothetical protein